MSVSFSSTKFCTTARRKGSLRRCAVIDYYTLVSAVKELIYKIEITVIAIVFGET